MIQLKTLNTLFLFMSICMISCGQQGLDIYKQGGDLLKKGNYKKAVEVFTRGIELNDITKSVNHYGRAYAYFELEQYEKAKADIEKSLVTELLNSEKINSSIYWLRAMIAEAEGDIKTQIDAYEKAIKYTPEDHELKTTLGFALIEDNQYDKAIEILTAAINTNSQDAYAFNNRGLAYLRTGQLDKSKSDLQQSEKLDDQNPFLYKYYFYYFMELEDLKKGCQAIETALEKDMSDYGDKSDTEILLTLQKEHCRN